MVSAPCRGGDKNLRKELVKCYIWGIDLYGDETWIHATHNNGMKANWIGHVLRRD